MDYFDKVCSLAHTEVVIEERLVGDLWKGRMELAAPYKKWRIEQFYQVFLEVMEELLRGRRYTVEDMKRSGYWEYLKGYHASWREDPLPNQMWHRFRRAINLFDDIRRNGMRDPLCVITENGKTYLYRGYRRLVILKVLGVEKAEVKHAIVHSDSHP